MDGVMGPEQRLVGLGEGGKGVRDLHPSFLGHHGQQIPVGAIDAVPLQPTEGATLRHDAVRPLLPRRLRLRLLPQVRPMGPVEFELRFQATLRP